MIDDFAMKFEILTDAHDITGFECESATINNYFKNYALEFQNRRLHKVHLAFDDDNLIGFFALSVYHIKNRQISGINFSTIWETYPHYNPCLFIEMIGVDQKYSSSPKHYGSKLIEQIIKIADILNQQYTAIRLIFLEALPNSIGFYFKNGFSILYINENIEEIKKFKSKFNIEFTIDENLNQIITDERNFNIIHHLEIGNEILPIRMFLDLLEM